MIKEDIAIKTRLEPGYINKFIEEIVNISLQLANALDYIFNMPTDFWLNLQNIYEKNNIKYNKKNPNYEFFSS